MGYKRQTDWASGGQSDIFQIMGKQNDFGPNHKWVYCIYPYNLTYFKNFLSYWDFKSNWNSCTSKIVNSPAWEKYIYEMQQKTQNLIISERKQIKKNSEEY